ncbi:hypothetical protein [Mannheimia indoligenes]|uniref:hypothetical protein n=1 Tax=Mannheimia indoligenes TaxID=3103145 RepID=UPI002FE52A1F
MTSYNAQNQVSRIYNTEKDQYGREVIYWVDNNRNGKFDGDEVKHFVERDPVDGKLISRLETYANGSPDQMVRFHFDETALHRATLFDTNKNGMIDTGERYDIRKFIEGSRTQVDYLDIYLGTQDGVTYGVEPVEGLKFNQVQKIHYSESGQSLGTIYGNGEREFKSWSYNGGSGGTVRSSVEDYTDSKFEPLLAQIGGKLERIDLSNATQSTQITLDNDVLAKLSSQVKPTKAVGDTTESLVLTINGDATDKVNLKDYNEFTKAEGTVKVGSNDYDKLTTEVEGKTYTLLVDTDIKLFDAANPGVEII